MFCSASTLVGSFEIQCLLNLTARYLAGVAVKEFRLGYPNPEVIFVTDLYLFTYSFVYIHTYMYVYVYLYIYIDMYISPYYGTLT